MNKQEAIDYCHKNRDRYIKDSDSVDDGIEQFDCLVSCLESGHIQPDKLSDYGMDY